MKVKIDSGEWYPYYYVCSPDETYFEGFIEMTEEEYAAWQKADKEIEKWHDFISERLERK